MLHSARLSRFDHGGIKRGCRDRREHSVNATLHVISLIFNFFFSFRQRNCLEYPRGRDVSGFFFDRNDLRHENNQSISNQTELPPLPRVEKERKIFSLVK